VRWRGRGPRRVTSGNEGLWRHAHFLLSTTTLRRVRRPFHHPSGGPPSPLSRGRKQARSRIPARAVTSRHDVTKRKDQRNAKGQSADRRVFLPAASYGCRSASSGMRSPLGAPPRHSFRRPNATTQLRAALHSLADRYLGPCGPWTLSTAKLSQTPGRPVLMPAGSMPEAARERTAKSARRRRTRSAFRHASGRRPR
jgi:hypothetical protein